MAQILRVLEDGTTHTLTETGTGGLLYRAEHEGCQPIVGRVDRGQAEHLVDSFDGAIAEGRATLLQMDVEAFVRFRHRQ